MKTFFISQDLWNLVENEYTKSDKAEKAAKMKKFRKKHAKTLLVLQQAVTNSIFSRIYNAVKSNETWTILYKEFHRDNKVKVEEEVEVPIVIMVEVMVNQIQTTMKLRVEIQTIKGKTRRTSSATFVRRRGILRRIVRKS